MQDRLQEDLTTAIRYDRVVIGQATRVHNLLLSRTGSGRVPSWPDPVFYVRENYER